MKPARIIAKYLNPLLMILLFVSGGCATLLKPTPTTVGPQCNIMWDKTNNPKVTWYHVTVADESNQGKKMARFIPAENTKVSCQDAGADHEGIWAVTVQSCYDKLTCGPPTEVTRIRITAQ
jgi:hypothetical protein